MFLFIFDYNYGNFWQILIIFLPQETEMNILPNIYKLFYFSLTMSPLYVVKLKMTQKQPTSYAVHSVELIVPDFWRKSFNVRFFPYLSEHFFGSLSTKNLLRSRWFYQKFIFKLNIVNFNMSTKVKRSWHATCHSYDVIELVSKLHVVMEWRRVDPRLDPTHNNC